MPEPALAAIEFSSIAAGTRAGDAVVKRAAIATYRAGSIHPGRFLIVITGGVADVDESFRAALHVGGEAVLDRVFLPDAHASVHAACAGHRSAPTQDTLGVLETCTVAAAIHAADAAVKGAAITLREIRLGDGLGGKGIVHLDGELADVQAAVDRALAVIAPRGIEHRTAIIPAVHPLVTGEIAQATRFHR